MKTLVIGIAVLISHAIFSQGEQEVNKSLYVVTETYDPDGNMTEVSASFGAMTFNIELETELIKLCTYDKDGKLLEVYRYAIEGSNQGTGYENYTVENSEGEEIFIAFYLDGRVAIVRPEETLIFMGDVLTAKD